MGIPMSGRWPVWQTNRVAYSFINHPEIMAQFSLLSGEEAFWIARKHADLIRSDWREINVQVMREVLRAKISQNPHIAGWLEATGLSIIIEHTPVKGRDAFWADDHDGSGKNMLGKLWMEIRAELCNSQK
ncbi:MAG: NADAR family protein [Parachlamydiales bacterium]|nr:NADAR family protein [Parachlamydiales bacterium]